MDEKKEESMANHKYPYCCVKHAWANDVKMTEAIQPWELVRDCTSAIPSVYEDDWVWEG